MKWTKRLMALALVGGVLLAVYMAGCTKGAGDRWPNLAPETMLSFSPDDGDTASYRVRMNWFGWDPDGEIAYFMTKWDDDDWMRVVNTDSVFLVSASADTLTVTHGYEYHSFQVKAIDNEGEPDPTPEYIAFTAFTIVPETRITRGPSGATGPMVTLEWQGSDRDGVVTGFQYRLFQRDESGEGSWVQVLPNPLEADWVEVGAEELSVIIGPLEGKHRFEIRALDDAGAADQTPAAKEFNCLPGIAKPTLNITSNVFGTFSFDGRILPDDAHIPISIFAGERIRFRWGGLADDYNGEIVGYRHAYDDTAVWPAWSIYDSEFEVTPTPGIHSLYIRVIDNSNNETHGKIVFNVVEASLDEYILIVDDYNWNEPGLMGLRWGTDEQRNQFYDQLLAGYARERVEWEPAQHVGVYGAMAPTVDALQGASTVLWYCDHEVTTLADLFDEAGAAPYNTLVAYARVGGNVILCGRELVRQITSMSYPSSRILSIDPEDMSIAARFVYDFLGIESVRNSGSYSNKSSPNTYGFCFYGGIPKSGFEDEFEPIYIDSVGPAGFPDPGKWYLYTWLLMPGTVRGGISLTDIVETHGTAIEFLGVDSFLNQNFEGGTCGVLRLSGDNHGNSCVFTFPLYYCRYDGVKTAIDQVLMLFGEEKLN